MTDEKNLKRHRGWCFTVNNWTDQDCADCMETAEKAQYLICGFEVGKEGTPHIQGYMRFKTEKSLKQMKECIPRGSFYGQKGTCHEAFLYAMKDNKTVKDQNYIEFGNRPKQGERTDLEAIRHDLLNGVSLETVADNYFSRWVYHRRSFGEYIKLKAHYNTKLLVYDSQNPADTFETIFIEYMDITNDHNVPAAIFMYSDAYFTLNDLCYKFYTSKYKYIIIPSNYELPNNLLSHVERVIE